MYFMYLWRLHGGSTKETGYYPRSILTFSIWEAKVANVKDGAMCVCVYVYINA